MQPVEACEAGWSFVLSSCLCFLLPLMGAIGVVIALDDRIGEPLALAVAVAVWWLALQGIRQARCLLRRSSYAAS